MTTPTTPTPDTGTSAPVPTPPPAEANTDDAGTGTPDNGNREAAKYRRRLRDTEAERDALTTRLDAAEAHLLDYALSTAQLDRRLWDAAGIDLDECRTSDGLLDVAAVIARAATVEADLGVTRGVRPNPQQGVPSRSPATSLADAFNPLNQR